MAGNFSKIGCAEKESKSEGERGSLPSSPMTPKKIFKKMLIGGVQFVPPIRNRGTNAVKSLEEPKKQ
jgi:hypothetical protein